MSGKGYVAFDLGAESGRATLATLDGERLVIEEIHRFANRPQRLPSGYHWNILDLWANLVEGLRMIAVAAKQRRLELVSLGVDTWGVDMALLGPSGQLLGLPYAYRDESNGPAMDKAIRKIGREAIYRATGIQITRFNTLYQLIARHDTEMALVNSAAHLLNISDLLHYLFSGKAVNEATIASTTQMVDPFTGQWHTKLLADLSLPTHFLKPIVPSGTELGKIRDEVAAEAGVAPIEVIVPASHDTASAVAAVPIEPGAPGHWAYVSSGTWSLMGVELDAPFISDESFAANFTNERGVVNSIRFLKNLAGLWLVQELRRDFARQGRTYDYPALTAMASRCEPFRTLVDPGHEPFACPGDFCAKINAFAVATGQPEPDAPGQYVRCCLESLALLYRDTLDQLENVLGKRFERLHIVGGGGRNGLLNQMTADATGRHVWVGPYEATIIGNALTQAMGRGDVEDLAHLRRIVRASVELIHYEPCGAADFDAQARRFQILLGQ